MHEVEIELTGACSQKELRDHIKRFALARFNNLTANKKSKPSHSVLCPAILKVLKAMLFSWRCLVLCMHLIF